MSETKHTSGEWSVYKWSETEDGEQPERTSDFWIGNESHDICYMGISSTNGVDETGPDAHLISAAPLLYKELEESNSRIEQALNILVNMQGRDSIVLMELLNSQYPENSKALAKARGEK